MFQEDITLHGSQGKKDKRGRTIDMMKCKFYSDYICKYYWNDSCHYCEKVFGGPPASCYYINDFENCICSEPTEHKGEEDNRTCFKEPKEKIKKGPIAVEDMITPDQLRAIMSPKYSAKISIGNWEINLTDKTFTEEQIKNMKEMLGWEVENL